MTRGASTADTDGNRNGRAAGLPDPTYLTTQQLLREIANLELRLTDKIESIEKAIVVAHEDLVRVPTAVDKAILTLHDLAWERFTTVDVKFQGIATQFSERDTRVEQTRKEAKDALDAALQAAKELVGGQQQANTISINKSEAGTKEQIAALGTTFVQNSKATDEKIDDLKDRLTRIEGQGKGRGDAWSYIIAALSIIVALFAVFWRHP
jgi:hypothetical protein